MGHRWHTREYRPGDETGIIALWKLVFAEGEQERGGLDYWNWQYRDNPAGPGRIMLAIADQGIAGQYAVVPMRLQFLGKSILATLSLDTMTHPDYRRQGMFGTLAKQLYAELGRDGLPITYGFPNENSVGGFVKKLEWTHICSLSVYVRPIRLTNIAEKVVENSLALSALKPFASIVGNVAFRIPDLREEQKAHVRWLSRFDSRFDLLWTSIYDNEKIAITRSADYLNWRYFENPTRDYRVLAYEEDGQLIAYAVLRCMEEFGLNGGMITELLSLPNRDDALQVVLDAALAYFADEGIDLVACLCHGDDHLTALLRRKRFLLPPGRFTYKEWYFGARLNADVVGKDVLNDPNNWYLTFGDTDII